MKSFIVGYLVGIAFTVAFSILFPIIMGFELSICKSYFIYMLRNSLILGFVFAIVFYLISLVSERNRRKRDLENAMTEFFRNNSKN